MRILTVFFALIFYSGLTHAQGVFLHDTITWFASSDQNKKTGEVFVRKTTFVSYGAGKLAITNFSHPRTFRITGIDNSWTDPQQAGKIVFRVLYNNKAGTVSIERSSGKQIFLTVDMTASDPGSMNSVYTIDHFTRQ